MTTIIDAWIDKRPWGDGPWTHEPDRVQWTDAVTGLDCLALRPSPFMGNWCGYVAIAPGHPWHGFHYDDDALGALLVHGGLTFSGPCMTDDRPHRERVCHVRLGEDDDVWWFGFDCGHLTTDIVPGYEARERDLTAVLPGLPAHAFPNAIYRTLDYVGEQCGLLAFQIGRALA